MLVLILLSLQNKSTSNDIIHTVIDTTIDNTNIILKVNFYKENNIKSIVNDMSYVFYEMIIYKNDNIYDVISDVCTYSNLDVIDSCLSLLSYCMSYVDTSRINEKPKYSFGIVAAPFKDTKGGTVVSHYLVDRLNYYFANDKNHPIAYILPALGPHDNVTWYTYTLNTQYNTPMITKLQYFSDENLILIYPESTKGDGNEKMIVRWILYFLNLQNDESIMESSYKYKSSDYIACYSKGICSQFDNSWHKHPLRVIDLNLDMFDNIDTNRVKDIDVVYFTPHSRKENWIDSRGIRITLNNDNFEYMLKNSFILMNKTVVQMDTLMIKQERLELLSRATYFISLDPATFRSVEAAMVGCLSIVVPVPGVNKSEWSSVSYAPEYLRYGIAYGFDDIEHARSTMDMVLPNLRDQDRKTRDILVDFIKDIKEYFQLDADFLQNKLN